MKHEGPEAFFASKKPERGPDGYELEDVDALDLTTSHYLLIDDEPVRITQISKIGDVSYQLENGGSGNLGRSEEIKVIKKK